MSATGEVDTSAVFEAPDGTDQLTTVKTTKKALGACIKFINAHPEALAAHFADDEPGLKAARQALKQLRGAWQPLNAQTPVQQLCVALQSMKAELHGRLNFQEGAPSPEDPAQLQALWSEYLRLCRALRLDTQAATTAAAFSALPAGQDLTQLPGFTSVDQMVKNMQAPAKQAEAEKRRAEAQQARIDAAQDELLRKVDSGELSEDFEFPTDAAISSTGPVALAGMIKSWAVVHPQVGFYCLRRLVVAAQGGSWAWFEAARILSERAVLQAIVDCVAACAELPPDEIAAESGNEAGTTYTHGARKKLPVYETPKKGAAQRGKLKAGQEFAVLETQEPAGGNAQQRWLRIESASVSGWIRDDRDDCVMPYALGNQGYSLSQLQFLAGSGLAILLSGTCMEGARWSESAGGMAAKHTMMQVGALELAVAGLLGQVDHQPSELHLTSANLIAAICFGACEHAVLPP